VAKSFRGEGLVPGSDTIPFSACAEAVVALKVRPILPGDLAPQFGAVTPPGCLGAAVAPHATRAGQGTLAVPAAGDYLVQVVGAGGTLGAFRWTAKVKPVKPSKAAVGVNAGAPAFPGPGPLPSKPLAGGGQAVAGFDADALGLGWREYRVQGNSRNSANLLVFRGNDASRLGNNFADDGTPDPRTVALGPTHLLVEANGELWAFPRDGSPGAKLFDPGVDTARVLCDGAAAYVLTPLGVLSIPLAGGTPQPTLLPPAGILDMAFGGRGLVYVLDQGALLEVHTSRTDGTDDVILSPVDPDPGLKALAARGGDVFLATDEGPTDSRILRVPACGGAPVEIHRGAPVSALAADELNVYGIETDPVNGSWVRQFPRGGGVSQVLVRSDGTAFVIDPSDVATAGGWVYFLASSGGDPEFRRVKRR
jgi:hypothetical protein